MQAKNFFKEFLDILKNNFWPMGAYTPRSQNGFPVTNSDASPTKYCSSA
jgi:hypothetical protein